MGRFTEMDDLTKISYSGTMISKIRFMIGFNKTKRKKKPSVAFKKKKLFVNYVLFNIYRQYLIFHQCISLTKQLSW